MSAHLEIAGITGNEPVESVQVESDGKTFHVVMAAGDTTTALFQQANDGRAFDVVGIVMDNATWALKNVFVTSVQFSGDGSQATVTFAADEVSQV